MFTQQKILPVQKGGFSLLFVSGQLYTIILWNLVYIPNEIWLHISRNCHFYDPTNRRNRTLTG